MSEEIYLATIDDLDEAKSKDINTEYKWEYTQSSDIDLSLQFEDKWESDEAEDRADIGVKKISYGKNAIVIINSYIDLEDKIDNRKNIKIYNLNSNSASTITIDGYAKNIMTDSEYLHAILYETDNQELFISMIDTSDINDIKNTVIPVTDDEIITNSFYVGGFYYYSYIPFRIYNDGMDEYIEFENGTWHLRKIEKVEKGKYNISTIYRSVYDTSDDRPDYLNDIDYVEYNPNKNQYYYSPSSYTDEILKVYDIAIDETIIGNPITISESSFQNVKENNYRIMNFKYYKDGYLYTRYNKLYFNGKILFDFSNYTIDYGDGMSGTLPMITKIVTDGKNTIAIIAEYVSNSAIFENYKLISNNIQSNYHKWESSTYGNIYLVNNGVEANICVSTDGGKSWSFNTLYREIGLSTTTIPYMDIKYNYLTDTFLNLLIKYVHIDYINTSDYLYFYVSPSKLLGETTTLTRINPNNEYSCKKAIDDIMKGKRLLVENYIVDKIVSLTGTKKSTTLLQFDLSAILSSPSEFNVNNFKLQFDTINITSSNNQPIITRSYDSSTGLLSITSSVSLFNSSCKATIWILKNVYN